MGMNFASGNVVGFPTTGLATLESYLIEFPGEFDTRGQVELRADSGLMLLYGRNGSGKTSALRTIKSCLAGVVPESLESPICRLLVKLSDWDSEDQEYLSRPELRGCQSFIRGMAQSVLRHQGFEQDWSESDYRVEFVKWAKEFAEIDPQLTELPDGWLSSVKAREHGSQSVDVYEECIRFVSKSRTRLFAVPLIEDAIAMSFVGSMEKGSERFQHTVRLIKLVLSDPLLILSPFGSPQSPHWIASIAARNLGPHSPFYKMLEEQECALGEYLMEHGVGDFSEIEAFEAGVLPTGLLRRNPINSAWGGNCFALNTLSQIGVHELPFNVIDANAVKSVEETLNSQLSGDIMTLSSAWMFAHSPALSGSEVDSEEFPADEPDDSAASQAENFSNPRYVRGPFGPVDVEDLSLVENAATIQRFWRDLETSLSLLGSCDVRVSSASLQLCTQLEDLKQGKFLDVSFYEEPGRTGPFSVSFDDLSDGQCKLINLAFAAVAAASDDSGKSVIFIGDEIDSGIHVRAIIGLYRMLGSLPLSCICSTHSIDAVAHTVGRRVHVTRDAMSGISVQDFDISDARAAAERMGVTPLSLMAFFRVIMIVEGEHDRIVLESLFSAQDSLPGTDVMVLPIRGANNLMTSLEAEFLDYTDAKILVVLDNVRQSVIAELLETAKSKQVDNPRDARSRLLDARGRLQSHEERIICDVILRRYDKGDLSRFSLFGLSKRDVIEYLTPGEFRLDDWDAIRKEHDSLAPTDPLAKSSFKDYLRVTRKISVSNDDVTRASRNLGQLHPDLVALIEHTMKQLGGRSLELGFGFAES